MRRFRLALTVAMRAALGTCAMRPLPAQAPVADSVPTPRPLLTPGAVSSRSEKTVCAKGYSSRPRPTAAQWRALRKQVFASYGIDWRATGYQLDHLVPFALGGASVPANLWPQPLKGPYGAAAKDTTDGRYAVNLVCTWHKMTLDSAQTLFATPDGWLVLYRQYHHESPQLRKLMRPEAAP